MVRLVAVPDPDDEAVRLVAEVQTALPQWRASQSSPLWYALEQRAADLAAERALLNESGRALVVSDAVGEDLDQLLANFAMTRQAGETDAELRARVPDHWAQLANDTEPGIIRRALAVPGVADATMRRDANYQVTLWLQGAGFTAPTEALRTAVMTAMNARDAKPWYADFVVAAVAAHRRTDYTVVGTVGLTADTALLRQQVIQAINDVALAERRLNRTTYLSQYTAAAHAVEGVVYTQLAFGGAQSALTTLAGAVDLVWVGSAAAAGAAPATNLAFTVVT